METNSRLLIFLVLHNIS